MGITSSARRTTRRAAVAGIATALTVGGLVGASAGSAEAASSSATYNCDTLLGSFPIPVSLVTDALTSAVPTGAVVPSDLIPVSGLASLPETLLSALSGLGLTSLGATISGFDLTAGDTVLPLDGLTAATTTLPGTGGLDLPVSGTLGGFTVPLPGLYDISLPASFDMLPLGGLLGTITCAIDPASNPVLGQLNVLKQTSSTSGTVVKSGKKYKARATVVRQLGLPGTGSVIAKVGKRTLASKNLSNAGTASFKLPKSARGKKLTLIYSGDTLTNGSKAALRVK